MALISSTSWRDEHQHARRAVDRGADRRFERVAAVERARVDRQRRVELGQRPAQPADDAVVAAAVRDEVGRGKGCGFACGIVLCHRGSPSAALAPVLRAEKCTPDCRSAPSFVAWVRERQSAQPERRRRKPLTFAAGSAPSQTTFGEAHASLNSCDNSGARPAPVLPASSASSRGDFGRQQRTAGVALAAVAAVGKVRVARLQARLARFLEPAEAAQRVGEVAADAAFAGQVAQHDLALGRLAIVRDGVFVSPRLAALRRGASKRVHFRTRAPGPKFTRPDHSPGNARRAAAPCARHAAVRAAPFAGPLR